jgi:hypothetical protein
MMHTTSYQHRVKTGFILLLILGVFSSQHPVQFLRNIYNGLGQPDEISLFTSQISCLREALPAHGLIGYFTNEDGTAQVYDIEGGKRYFLTQYTLAPLVVEPGLNHQWIVGNLQDRIDVNQITRDLELELIKDCTDGTFLFRKID